MFEKVEGFILKTQDYGETHKIVTMITPTMGKIGAIARGAKKTKSRMAAITQPFIHGTFLIQKGSSLSTLQQGDIISSYRKIREDIYLTAYASYIAELTDKLVDAKRYNPTLFLRLVHTLGAMEEGKDPEILLMIYEWKLYKIAGFAPVMDQCATCGKKDQLVAFSVREGGMQCINCATNHPYAIPINETIYKLLRMFTWLEMDRIGNISIKQENKLLLKQLMEQYYEEHGGYFLKSKRFLDQMNRMGKL